MSAIRLINEVRDPGNRGPSRGMFALQKALKAAKIPWLRVGGGLRHNEIPWVWLYRDAGMAIQFNDWGWPFVLGPNVLFSNSRNPGSKEFERRLLDAENCAMMFTESDWYAALIRQHCNHNEAPVVIWRYPIEPQPAGPLPVKYDLLVYLKDMNLGREQLRAVEHWPRSNVVVYGTYCREEMIELARQSRACLYLSTDDRGPLAAAEIALAGCPLVGVERGCPWVCWNALGVQVKHFGTPDLFSAVEQAMGLDRDCVRECAQSVFSTERTVATIRSALEPIADKDLSR